MPARPPRARRPRSDARGRRHHAPLLLLAVLLAGGSLAVAATHATAPTERPLLASSSIGPTTVDVGKTVGALEPATAQRANPAGHGDDATDASSSADRRPVTVRVDVPAAATRPAAHRLVAPLEHPLTGSLERPDPLRQHADALADGEVTTVAAPSRDDDALAPDMLGTQGEADASDPDGNGDADRDADGDGDADGDDGSNDASDDEVLAFETDDGDRIDAERIEQYLDDRGAPLAEHAQTFVEAGVEQDVDPRLVVGIAIAESNGGKQLPPSTYNAWGWSGNGPQGLHSWSSWDESIHDFTARLSELYDTDNVDESFAQTYVPPNWRWWLDVVHMVKADI